MLNSSDSNARSHPNLRYVIECPYTEYAALIHVYRDRAHKSPTTPSLRTWRGVRNTLRILAAAMRPGRTWASSRTTTDIHAELVTITRRDL